MNEFTNCIACLSESLSRDPLLLLASAVATFDPYWNSHDEEEYEDDPLQLALRVTRDAFPDIYAQALERLRIGAAYEAVDRFICHAITAKGIPVDDLYMIGWGIPLPAFGAELTEHDFYEAHPELLPVLSLFGISKVDGESAYFEVPENAYEAGRALALSLLEQTDTALRQVGSLLGWLFSCTGNSLVDCTDEALADFEPMSWSKDDVAFAIEMIAEADEFMRDAMAGLKHVNAVSELTAMLQRNIAAVREMTRKGERGEHCIQLAWTGTGSGTERTAVSDSGVLHLRPDAA